MTSLQTYDFVKVKPNLGKAYPEHLFPQGVLAIIVTVFGHGKDKEFRVYIKDVGEVRGYKKEHLEFLDGDAKGTLELWKKQRAA